MSDCWRLPLAEGQTPEGSAVRVTQRAQPNPVITCGIDLDASNFLVIDIALQLPDTQLDQYTCSKLYFSDSPDGFSEEKTCWFTLRKTDTRQMAFLPVPDILRDSPCGYFMVDALPLLQDCEFVLHGVYSGTTGNLLYYLRHYDPVITPQVVALAGELRCQDVARDLVSLLARKLRTGSFAIDYTLTNAIIRALEKTGNAEALALMANRLAVHNYHHCYGLLDNRGHGEICGVQNGEDHAIFLGEYPAADYVLMDLLVDIDWANTRFYDYCKLYFSFVPVRADNGQLQAFSEEHVFSEENVACFRVLRAGQRERIAVRLPLPDGDGASWRVALRLDPLPGCRTGRFAVSACRTVNASACDETLRKHADLNFLKQQTRRAVADSEARQVSPIRHLPESITLELTPRCDFTCGHCSSHGTKELHDEYNRMPVFPEQHLDRLAADVFPALSTLTIVGRGEPSIVPDKYWQKLMGHLRAADTRFTMVTHGYHIPRRITADNIDLVDTITISIDGITQDTYAKNRGGKTLQRVLQHATYYHELRKQSRMARRPRLCFSWTLLKNNIHEFPDFVRYVSRFEPDLLYVRHLLVYHSKDMEQSLFDEPERANHYLREAYAVMAQHGIRGDCPPLFNDVEIELGKHRIASSRDDDGFRPIRGTQDGEPIPVILGSYRKAGACYVRLSLAVTVDPADARRYQHSKLYYDRSNRRHFSEKQVVCFVMPRNSQRTTVVLRLPFALGEGETVGFRLDPLAGCRQGSFEITDFALVDGNSLDAAQREQADRQHHITTIRQHPKDGMPGFTRASMWAFFHLPVSGAAIQKQAPRLPEVATVVLVDDDRLDSPPDKAGEHWPQLLADMHRYRHNLRLHTTGNALPLYINDGTADLLDGVVILASRWDTHRAVPTTVANYHAWRTQCGLARRPRLHIRWELTADNAAALPACVAAILPLDIDTLIIGGSDTLLASDAVIEPLRRSLALLAKHQVPCEVASDAAIPWLSAWVAAI